MAALLGAGPPASWRLAAHTLAEGRWDAVVTSNRILCRITVSLDEVARGTGRPGAAAVAGLEAWTRAADDYGRRLAGAVQVFSAGAASPPVLTDFAVVSGDARPEVAYSLEFPAAAAGTAPPNAPPLRFRQDSGSPPGTPPADAWDAAYWLTVTDVSGRRLGATILPRGVSWSPPADRAGEPRRASWPGFVRLGVLHILNGWDHLLFLGAIALGARRWRDFFLVAAVFTTAHSITVAFTAWGWLRPADRWVDPVIAASILFVAAENAAAPRRANSPARLGLVFAFGLVHGLGFAGGLTAALKDESAGALAAAVAAFCAGVEAGHLAVGIPFYGLLRWFARSPAGGAESALIRRASWGVAAGGAWFLASSLARALG